MLCIEWPELSGEEKKNWFVVAQCLRLDSVRTPAEKKEALYRLCIVGQVRGLIWFKERKPELQRPGFWYTCNVGQVSRSKFLSDLMKGVLADAQYAVDKELNEPAT